MNTNKSETWQDSRGHVFTHEPNTANGYDTRWIDVINEVLSNRETGIQISDINEGLWDEYIGPMIDAIEDGHARPTANNAGLVEYELR